MEEALHEFSATELRGGKGAVNTKSSGNSFRSGRSTLENNFCTASGARALGLSCYNANMESSQSSPYYFSVGAVNSDGKHTSYSTAGANLMVVAPAGEYGDTAPAMVTVDQMTCLRGYSSFPSADFYDEMFGAGYFASIYPFNNPGHEDNPSCNYTNSFNGTSSAAPNTAGVVSLILSANPNLSYRDVRHILASTSTKVDSTNAQVKLPLPDGEFVAHPGWVKNKAGFEHNNFYGFGRVNAGKAVEMAKSYKANLGTAKMSEWTGIGVYAEKPAKLTDTVADNSAKGVEFSINVADDIVLEGAQFRFTVANSEITMNDGKEFHSTAGSDLAIEVTSPQGTRSVLLSSRQALLLPAAGANFYPGYILKDSVMLSHAFYGEKAKGTWKIKVLDVNGAAINATGGLLKTKGYLNNTALSVVEGVAVRVFGH
jgi:subtilisin-like proprotein convertase family protein